MPTKISALPAAGSIVDTDPIPVVTGGATKKTTAAQILSAAAAGSIPLTKLTSGTAAQIPITNAGGTAFVAVSITGDVLVTSTGVTSIASGVIVDADVNGSAAIAGSKISPAFGAQNVTLTGYVGIGGTIPTAGDIRGTNTFQIRVMNSTNAAEKNLIKVASDVISLGDSGGGIASVDFYANQSLRYISGPIYDDATDVNWRGSSHGGGIAWNMGAGGAVAVTGTVDTAVTSFTIKQADKTTNGGTGATTRIQAQNETGTTSIGGELQLAAGTGTTNYGNVVLTGGLDGGYLGYTFASDANQTLTPAQSAVNILNIAAGVITAGRTITLSRPAAKAGYIWVRNNTAQTVTIAWLSGTGVTLATNTSALVCSDGTNAVKLMTGT